MKAKHRMTEDEMDIGDFTEMASLFPNKNHHKKKTGLSWKEVPLVQENYEKYQTCLPKWFLKRGLNSKMKTREEVKGKFRAEYFKAVDVERIIKSLYSKGLKDDEVKSFYRTIRKVIHSKVLTDREACDMATLFMIISAGNKDEDYLYNKLLDLNIKPYKR